METDIERLFEHEKRMHPDAQFLDGALLRDRGNDQWYPVVLVVVHYEDPAVRQVRMAIPGASVMIEQETPKPTYGKDVGLGGAL